MLRQVLKRALSLSAIAAFAFGLLMLDTDSPSLMSEAKACDPVLFAVCYQNCGFACVGGAVQGCQPPYNEQNCDDCCTDICAEAAGC